MFDFKHGTVRVPRGIRGDKVPSDDVTIEVEVLDAGKRITATRLVALGPLGLALRKHKQVCLLTLTGLIWPTSSTSARRTW